MSSKLSPKVVHSLLFSEGEQILSLCTAFILFIYLCVGENEVGGIHMNFRVLFGSKIEVTFKVIDKESCQFWIDKSVAIMMHLWYLLYDGDATEELRIGNGELMLYQMSLTCLKLATFVKQYGKFNITKIK